MITNEIKALEEEIQAKRKKIIELKKSSLKLKIESNYVFPDLQGTRISLNELFGDKSELIVIHNMGKGCPYCTMWADGLNGMLPHLENRAAFVVISPDQPDDQRIFAQSRGWNFRMISGFENTFIKDMGFATDGGEMLPGISTFYKDASGTIWRTAGDEFGPGDFYCASWHMFDLLEQGENSWQPDFSY